MRRMKRVVSAGLALTAGFLAWGCDTGCTEIGCVDGVEIWFAAPLDESSEFSVSVQMDEEHVQCDYAYSKALDTCAKAGVWVQGGPRVDGFLLPGRHPKQVTFAFSASGTVVVSATVNPTYVTQQPNGPDCPSTCENGQIKL